jgi:HK97 family phage major capsid protein
MKSATLTGTLDERLAFVRERNAELNALGVKREGLVELLAAAKAAEAAEPDRKEGPAATKGSFGEQYVKAHRSSRTSPIEIDVDVKTLMSTAAGWTPEALRSGRVVDFATRPIQVTDLIPMDPTTLTAYTYMEETTFTNAAAEVAEGGIYAEAALALTQRTQVVRKVGVWLPITDEQLEDEPGAAAYVNRRLPFMVSQRLDQQILTGSGAGVNLLGVNNVVGIQTQAKGADPVFDALLKGATKVKVTGRAMPTAVVLHPNDWQDIRLTRTVEGIYILGSPVEAGPSQIWGMRVVESDAQIENTAVLGDWAAYSLLAVRRGIEVQTTNSHAGFFIEGKQAIRADMRAALVFLRPAAFCTVTGI